jgi:hypothetical protein
MEEEGKQEDLRKKKDRDYEVEVE